MREKGGEKGKKESGKNQKANRSIARIRKRNLEERRVFMYIVVGILSVQLEANGIFQESFSFSQPFPGFESKGVNPWGVVFSLGPN